MPNAPSPKQLADQALRELKSAADDGTAKRAMTYFKPGDAVAVFGVATPMQRRIAAGLFQTVRGDWTIDQALSFCNILIKRRELESKNTGMFLLARYKKDFKPQLLEEIEDWLANDHCGNWAATDALCSELLAPLVRQHPVLIPRLKRWAGDHNLWLRRASIVGMIHCARRGEYLDDVYEIAESLLDYGEDLIHKANGWILREAGKADQKRLERFLLDRGPGIPRTTLRYAIERFSPETRKVLLEKTRAR
jgi:3-methyladenine DNA glycosylase AlkD